MESRAGWERGHAEPRRTDRCPAFTHRPQRDRENTHRACWSLLWENRRKLRRWLLTSKECKVTTPAT
ncbi:hypothetical protein AOLI_G00302560 [Acnodon oligacanthus]